MIQTIKATDQKSACKFVIHMGEAYALPIPEKPYCKLPEEFEREICPNRLND